jgi:hypothetical protein
MGRPPLFNARAYVNLSPDDLARNDAIVGQKGRSKFIRDAVRQVLDQVAPGEANRRPPFLESDGGHSSRLTSSGTAVLLDIVRRHGFDDLMKRLGFTDPAEFLHTLLGYRTLPDSATGILVTELLPKV